MTDNSKGQEKLLTGVGTPRKPNEGTPKNPPTPEKKEDSK